MGRLIVVTYDTDLIATYPTRDSRPNNNFYLE
jgi:hypothetical protein